ncbi:MAG: ABC transporter substrate-binding protein, partial [Alphaproteobacteria bacterium]
SIIWASGGAETLQTLITGSQDIAVGVGALAVLGAYAKGAPVVFMGQTNSGAASVYWYVPADSPIKTVKDLQGKQLVFSQPGSTTHFAAQYLLRSQKVDAKLVSVGGMAASRTQVMSGQVDTGWATMPTNFDLLRAGKIRILVQAEEIPEIQHIATSTIAANADWLKANRDVAKRFMRAYWKGVLVNWFSGDRGLTRYAKMWKLELDDVREMWQRSNFRTAMTIPVGGLDDLNKQAVADKYTKELLTKEQLAKIADYVFDPRFDE